MPAGLPASAGAAVDALGAVTGLLGPLAALVDGDPSALIAAAVERLAGATSTIGEQSEGALAVTGELRQFFTLLGSLDGWTTHAPPAEEVAALVAKAFIGADLDLLEAPALALANSLSGLDAVLPDGDDLTRWRTGLTTVATTWTAIETRVAADVDWPSLELDLQAAGRAQAELIAARDRLLAGAVAALGRLDLSGLAAVAAAMRAVPEIPEVRLTPILDGFVAQLRSLRDGLEHWELGPDDVRAVVRGLVQRLRDAIDNSPIGEIRRWLLAFEQRVLAMVDSLPLRAVADEITGTLDAVAAAVDDVDLDGLLAPVTHFGETVGAAISGLGGDAVRNTIGQVWDAVDTALNQAATVLGQLRDALDAITGPLGEFTTRVGPAVTAITDLITEVRVVVDAFDLAQPAAAVVDSLHRARDVVAAIDVSVLPADAVRLVGDAADALADVDVSAAVNGPIVAVLDAIDPGPALHAATDVLGEVATQLAAIDPAQLIATLDAPVGEVLDGLAALDPAQLQHLIDDAVAPVREAIGALDATAVLAPATQAFAELMSGLDGLLDPEPIFAPLQQAYQPVLDVVAALDPAALLDLVTPHMGGVTESFGGAAGGTVGPTAVTGGGAGFSALPSSVDASSDLFGFRPGDLLVPLIDLHHRLMSALEGLAADLLDEAAAALNAAFGGRLAALAPDAVLGRIDDVLARVEGDLGIVATTTAVADAAHAYQRVTARLAVAAAGATGDAVTVSVRVTGSLPTLDPLRLVASTGQATAVAAGSRVAATRADLSALRTAYAVGVARIEQLLPAFVGTGLDGSGLLGALRTLDPAPIRDEVNSLFDEAGQFLVGLGDAVVAALEELAAAAEDLLLPLNPTALMGLVTRIHGGLLAQVRGDRAGDAGRARAAGVRRRAPATRGARPGPARRPGRCGAPGSARRPRRGARRSAPRPGAAARVAGPAPAAAAEPAARPGDGGARPDQPARRGDRRRHPRAAARRRHRPHQGAGPGRDRAARGRLRRGPAGVPERRGERCLRQRLRQCFGRLTTIGRAPGRTARPPCASCRCPAARRCAATSTSPAGDGSTSSPTAPGCGTATTPRDTRRRSSTATASGSTTPSANGPGRRRRRVGRPPSTSTTTGSRRRSSSAWTGSCCAPTTARAATAARAPCAIPVRPAGWRSCPTGPAPWRCASAG